mgnify:CR=1 FL=1
MQKLSNLPDFPYEANYEKNISGFEDYEDAKDFSKYIGKELNIENLPFTENDTIH